METPSDKLAILIRLAASLTAGAKVAVHNSRTGKVESLRTRCEHVISLARKLEGSDDWDCVAAFILAEVLAVYGERGVPPIAALQNAALARWSMLGLDEPPSIEDMQRILAAK